MPLTTHFNTFVSRYNGVKTPEIVQKCKNNLPDDLLSIIQHNIEIIKQTEETKRRMTLVVDSLKTINYNWNYDDYTSPEYVQDLISYRQDFIDDYEICLSLTKITKGPLMEFLDERQREGGSIWDILECDGLWGLSG